MGEWAVAVRVRRRAAECGMRPERGMIDHRGVTMMHGGGVRHDAQEGARRGREVSQSVDGTTHDLVPFRYMFRG